MRWKDWLNRVSLFYICIAQYFLRKALKKRYKMQKILERWGEFVFFKTIQGKNNTQV